MTLRSDLGARIFKAPGRRSAHLPGRLALPGLLPCQPSQPPRPPVPRHEVRLVPPLSDVSTRVHVVKARRKSLVLKRKKPACSRTRTLPWPCTGSRGPASGRPLTSPCWPTAALPMAGAGRCDMPSCSRTWQLAGCFIWEATSCSSGEEHVFPAFQSLSKRNTGGCVLQGKHLRNRENEETPRETRYLSLPQVGLEWPPCCPSSSSQRSQHPSLPAAQCV